jgi:hypothetical protein
MTIGEYTAAVTVRVAGGAGQEAYEGVFFLGRLPDLTTVVGSVDLASLLMRAAGRVEPLTDEDCASFRNEPPAAVSLAEETSA